MKRLTTFVMGMAVGAAILLGALKYHVVRANDGLHLVPKLDAQLAGTYADIRAFTIADWAQNPDLAAALIDAGQRDLVEGSAKDALRNRLDQFLDGGATPQ
jgi:hypothetical protein